MAIKFLSGLNLSNVTAGSILKLDSNGNIVAATAGTDYVSSNTWSTASNSNIYYNSGGVRIGTYQSSVDAAAQLHVFDYQTTDPKLLIEDGNTGDASMQFKISTQQYTMGIDNSDSDKFVLAASSALGTTNVLEVATNGASAFQTAVLFNETIYLPGNGQTADREKLIDAHGTRATLYKQGNAAFWQVAQGGNQFEIVDAANGNDTKGNVLLRASGNDADDNRLYLVPGNGRVGINTTSASYTLHVNGTIGTQADNYKYIVSTNQQSSYAVGTFNLNMPLNGYLWHDLLAFDRHYTRTQEVSSDGSTWSSATLRTALFNQKQDQSIEVISSSNHAVRWTFQGVAWALPDFVNLAFTYTSPDANKTVLVESSSDGSTWTTRHTSTVSGGISTKTCYITGYGGENYLRITVAKATSSTNVVRMSSLRLMTSRAGDQGQGSEYHYPYSWDSQRNMAIGTDSVDSNFGLTVGNNLKISGTGLAAKATIEITNSSSGTFNHTINALAPNLTTGENNIFIIGRAASTKNSGYIGYKYSSAGSNDNLLTFGHWGSDNLMNLTGDGKLGIGTQSPHAELTVEGKIDTSDTDNGAFRVYDGSTFRGGWGTANWAGSNFGDQSTDLVAYVNGNNKYFIGTNAQPRLTVDGSGNVGIGTTSPSEKLEVVGTIQATSAGTATLILRGDSGNSGDTGQLDSTIKMLHDDMNHGILLETRNYAGAQTFEIKSLVSSAETSRFLIDQDGTLKIPAYGAGFLTTDANGDVSVDTTSYVDIAGDTMTGSLEIKRGHGDLTLLTLKQEDTSGDLVEQKSFIDFTFVDSNTNETPQVRIGAEVGNNDGSASDLYEEGSGAFVVYTNNADTESGAAGTSLAERLRVDYSGKVGIGTASPDYKLDVNGTFRATTVYSPIVRVSGTSDALTLRSDVQHGQGDEDAVIGFNQGTTELAKIDQEGYMYAAGFKVGSGSGVLRADGTTESITFGTMASASTGDYKDSDTVESYVSQELASYTTTSSFGSNAFTSYTDHSTQGYLTASSTDLDSRYYTETELTNFFKSVTHQGNYISTANWSNDGSGSVNQGWGAEGYPFSPTGDFNQNGATEENIRTVAELPNGAYGVVWRTPSNDASSNGDGGWDMDINNVQHAKAYRSVVYFQKTDDSTSGTFYHGCHGSHTLGMNGSANTNPYFQNVAFSNFVENRWYVSVGYIQPYQYPTATDSGRSGIYDCYTGKKIINGADFMMKSGSTTQRHRTYQYYSTDPSSSINWWNPRFEEINGNEPSLAELIQRVGIDGELGLNFHSKFPAGALDSLTEATDATNDKILLWDESADVWKQMTLEDLQDSIDTDTTNATTLDGIDSSSFLRSDTSDVFTFNTSTSEALKFANNTSGGLIQIGFQQNDTDGMHHRAYLQAEKSSVGNAAGKFNIIVRGNGGSTSSDVLELEASQKVKWQGSPLASESWVGSSYAPLASPALTGTPTAPTAGATVNTTQLATTAFVQTAIANLSDSAPATLNTLNELAAALGDDANFSTTVTTSIAAKLPLAGGNLTGNLGINSSSPAAPLDVQPASDYKVTKVGDDRTSHYKFTGQADHTLTLASGSYHSSEVVITAHQTNGGTNNNLYIRGIWTNNHTSHHWHEIENIGGLEGSAFAITNGQSGDITNSGELEIVHDYVSGSFGQMVVRVTDHYGTHSYTIS